MSHTVGCTRANQGEGGAGTQVTKLCLIRIARHGPRQSQRWKLLPTLLCPLLWVEQIKKDFNAFFFFLLTDLFAEVDKLAKLIHICSTSCISNNRVKSKWYQMNTLIKMKVLSPVLKRTHDKGIRRLLCVGFVCSWRQDALCSREYSLTGTTMDAKGWYRETEKHLWFVWGMIVIDSIVC